VPDGVFLLRAPFGGWIRQVAQTLGSIDSLNKLYGPVHWAFEGPDQTVANTGGVPATVVQNILSLNLEQGGAILLHDKLLSNGGLSCGPAGGCCTGSCPPNYQGRFAFDVTTALVPALKSRGLLVLPLEADPAFPGGMLFSEKSTWSPPAPAGSGSIREYDDPGGWGSHISYYGTFRLGDVSGDGKADLCARSCCSVVCSVSQGNGFAPMATWQPSFDAASWTAPERSTTIQLGDVNGDGKDDLCAINVGAPVAPEGEGVICALSNSNGTSFGSRQLWLSKAALPSELLTNPGYYRTVRLANVGGTTAKDLCFRASAGIVCALSQGTQFGTPTVWSASFADPNWLPLYHSGTIQFADINGDPNGYADVCGRGSVGIRCGLSNGTSSFEPTSIWTSVNGSPTGNFSNSDILPSDFSTKYTATFRLADIDGDKRADACIRSVAGFLCAQSLGSSFDVYRVWQKKDFRGQTWDDEKYAATVMLGDITGDGRADVCVRGTGADGVVCAASDWCPGCPDRDHAIESTLAGTGDEEIQPNGSSYSAGPGIHVAAMSGPVGTDFTLQLEKKVGAAWVTVVVPPGPVGSPQRITYQGTAGEYRWRIRSQRGSGPYQFWLKQP
jgi:hypothetical protein